MTHHTEKEMPEILEQYELVNQEINSEKKDGR